MFYFRSLQFAVKLAELLQHPAPKEWREVAEHLKIPFDQESQYHPEFDGYSKGSNLCLTEGEIVIHAGRVSSQIDDNSVFFDKHTGHPVKQADTVMLGYPLGLQMSSQIRRNDLEAYEPVTDPNGPAMTWVSQRLFCMFN